MPHDVTPEQLETLLNGLLQAEERLPYSFFVEEQELAADLGGHLAKHKAGAVGVCVCFSLYFVCLLFVEERELAVDLRGHLAKHKACLGGCRVGGGWVWKGLQLHALWCMVVGTTVPAESASANHSACPHQRSLSPP